MLLSGWARVGLGVALFIHEGMVRESAQPEVLIAAGGLLLMPEAKKFDQWYRRLRAMAAATVAADEAETEEEPAP